MVASGKMTRSKNRRRFRTAGILGLALGVGFVLTGIAFGLFGSTTPSSANAFSAGKVVVGTGGGASVQCNVTNLAPGDASSGYPSGSGVANQSFAQCRYFVTYSGSVPAYLGLDVAVANSGGNKLYDGTSTGLQLLVQDSSGTTYIGRAAGHGGTNYTAQSGASFGTTLNSGATASDLLISTGPESGSPTAFSDEFTVDYNLPIPASDANIGGTTTVTLTFHAVQAANNPLPSGCTSSGVSCTGLTWS